MKTTATRFPWILAALLLWLVPRAQAQPLGTAFTYQGQVTSGGTPVNGALTMTFSVYDSPGGPVPLASVILPSVPVTNGLFTVNLDFGGGLFLGDKRWLGIKIAADPELVPRQELTPAPGSLFASTAASFTGNALRIETTSDSLNAILELKDNSPGQTRSGAVNFLQGTDTVRGRIAYQNPDGPMTFRVAGANGMTLSTTGLDVAAGQVTLGSVNGAIAYQGANGPMTFTVAGLPEMTLTTTGLDIAGGQVTFGSVEGWRDNGTNLIATVGGSSVAIEGTLRTGGTVDHLYNQFGTGTTSSPNMNSADDVYIADDLDVDGITSLADTQVEGTASKTTAGGWLATSDRRLKTDIEGIEDALAVVRRLHPVRFRYNEEFLSKHPSVKDVYYHNYVAQEFEGVFPDSVQEDAEGFLQIDTYPAGVYAVAAIQELDRLVAEKDARISALEARVVELEAIATRLARIEKALGR